MRFKAVKPVAQADSIILVVGWVITRIVIALVQIRKWDSWIVHQIRKWAYGGTFMGLSIRLWSNIVLAITTA